MKKANRITYGDWFDELQRQIGLQPDKVPVGWETAETIAEAEKKTRRYITKVLKKGLLAGIVELKKFRVFNGKRVIWMPHYRMLPK